MVVEIYLLVHCVWLEGEQRADCDLQAGGGEGEGGTDTRLLGPSHRPASLCPGTARHPHLYSIFTRNRGPTFDTFSLHRREVPLSTTWNWWCGQTTPPELLPLWRDPRYLPTYLCLSIGSVQMTWLRPVKGFLVSWARLEMKGPLSRYKTGEGWRESFSWINDRFQRSSVDVRYRRYTVEFI